LGRNLAKEELNSSLNFLNEVSITDSKAVSFTRCKSFIDFLLNCIIIDVAINVDYLKFCFWEMWSLVLVSFNVVAIIVTSFLLRE